MRKGDHCDTRNTCHQCNNVYGTGKSAGYGHILSDREV